MEKRRGKVGAMVAQILDRAKAVEYLAAAMESSIPSLKRADSAAIAALAVRFADGDLKVSIEILRAVRKLAGAELKVAFDAGVTFITLVPQEAEVGILPHFDIDRKGKATRSGYWIEVQFPEGSMRRADKIFESWNLLGMPNRFHIRFY